MSINLRIHGDQFQNILNVDSKNYWEESRLTILFLADLSHPAHVVQDHINAFLEHSRHRFDSTNPISCKPLDQTELSKYDLVLIHYSIYILGDYFLPEPWSLAIKEFSGPVVQIIQDEQRNCFKMQAKMDDLGVVAVFGSLETGVAARVYTSDHFANKAYLSCLPGYFSDRLLSMRPKKHSSRPLDVVYRGRNLPNYLGRHASIKSDIARHIQQISHKFGLRTDISTTETDRIYGDEWYSFLESGRSTLIVEGGASIFDLDGSIQSMTDDLSLNPDDVALQEAVKCKLIEAEGLIVHKTITPRCFEAIALRTAVVAYPGDFRDLMTSKVHYVPLDPENRNINEVIEQVSDVKSLSALTERAFSEIAQNPSLHFQTFVRAFDAVVSTVSQYR